MEASQLFRRAWLGPNPEGKGGTYAEYTFEHPVFQSPPSNLDWLTPLDPFITDQMKPHWQERMELWPWETFQANLETLKRESKETGLKLPRRFAELMSSLELQQRIPSATACYFDLSDHLILSPFQTGDRIIRFLNDQQACCAWYLYFQKSSSPCVICSSSTEQSNFLDELTNTLPLERVEVIRKATLLVAPTFDAFLYRFWLENLNWNWHWEKVVKPSPLTFPSNLFSWIKSRLRR